MFMLMFSRRSQARIQRVAQVVRTLIGAQTTTDIPFAVLTYQIKSLQKQYTDERTSRKFLGRIIAYSMRSTSEGCVASLSARYTSPTETLRGLLLGKVHPQAP